MICRNDHTLNWDRSLSGSEADSVPRTPFLKRLADGTRVRINQIAALQPVAAAGGR